MKSKKLNLSTITNLGLLIAIQIILSRFFSISTPLVKIGFGFVPLAVIGILYGPLIGGISSAICDILGAILFPTGAYFPGFTLTAFLIGFTYGYFLHNKTCSFKRTLIPVTIICFLTLTLNTYWVTLITGKGFLVLLGPRIIKNLILIPIKVVVITLVWDKLLNKIKIFN